MSNSSPGQRLKKENNNLRRDLNNMNTAVASAIRRQAAAERRLAKERLRISFVCANMIDVLGDLGGSATLESLTAMMIDHHREYQDATSKMSDQIESAEKTTGDLRNRVFGLESKIGFHNV